VYLLALSLQFQPAMKQELRRSCGHALRAALLIALGISSTAPAVVVVAQKPATQTAAKDRRTVTTFEGRAKAYVKLRNRIKSKLPKLSKDSTPEQIAAHKKAFEDAVRLARVGAKPGDIFTADTAEYIRRLIRTEFKGTDRREVKETILEADTATGVPLRVNYPYPETKEFSAVPPTLLLTLPQLPKELNYRFTGLHMMLIDKENGLILDYMLKALP
jgi:hypothetical protein